MSDELTITEGPFELFVNGTLMRGLALHANLNGADFVQEARTVPRYRLFSIGDVHPGMYEISDGGVSVEGEIYRVPLDIWRRVEAGEPPGLYCGLVHLDDGRSLPGILYHREHITARHRDISVYGGWRAYTAATPPGQAPSSAGSVPDTNRASVLRIYQEVLNQGRYELVPELFASDAVDHRKVPGLASGLDNILEGARINRAAFPDLLFTVEDIAAVDDLVFAHWVMRGTHQGDYLGQAATGLPIEWRGITQFRFAGNRVVERWLYADPLSGAASPPA